MRAIFSVLVTCFVWAAYVPPTQAQYICHSTLGTNAGDSSQNSGFYEYTALSCKGNSVVVAADVTGEWGGPGYYLAFLISRNGGKSWAFGHNGLPNATWSHKPIITSIDQIDSLHVVAFGDSDLLVRTTDGGATWKELQSPSKNFIEGISFSDSTHGMLMAADTVVGTYLTTDGGEHWSAAPFTRAFAWQCHDYGNGRYRVATYGSGVVYTTNDGWKTFDSTSAIVQDEQISREYVYFGFKFAGDTIIGHGNRFASNGMFPCIARTTDGGKHWTSVYDDTSWSLWGTGSVHAMSSIDRDTIVAGLRQGPGNRILRSTDRGLTWRRDSLIILDTTEPPSDSRNYGIGLNAQGQLLDACFNGGGFVVLLGASGTNRVENRKALLREWVYPNPAATLLTLHGSITAGSVRLIDLCGNEVLRGEMERSGSCTMNVSALSAGVYIAEVEYGGRTLAAARVVVVH